MSKKCTPLWREAHLQAENVQNTPGSDHFWRFRCRKSARRCGRKHISKSNCIKQQGFGPLLEVQMSKKCMRLWRAAHFEVKLSKTPGVRTTFGGSDVEKVRGVVARSISRSENVQNTRGSDHFWRFRCRFASIHYTTGHYTTLHSTTLHYTTFQYTTLDYTTLQYTLIHYITLHHVTLHYTTLNYTTLRYITLHYTTLHSTTLHFTTLSSTTPHYLTLHYTPLHYNYNYNYNYNYTPLHSTTLNYTTLHYIIEGSLEVKLPTIWTDEKQSRAEAERRERSEERRVEEKE